MIKHKDSHMDHGFSQAQWDHIFKTFEGRDAFFNETIELPEDLGTVKDSLYGPSIDDAPVPESEVHYAPRGDRAWPSRLVKRPPRETRFVRVIAGPHADPCGSCEGKGTLPVETMQHEWKSEACPACEGTGKGEKYACILYTAYGVMKKDAPRSPPEPGDINRELNSIDPETCSSEDLKRYNALREQLAPSKDFWSQHGLAWKEG